MGKKEKKAKKEKPAGKEKQKKEKKPVYTYDKVMAFLGGLSCLYLLFMLAVIVLVILFRSAM